jgi:hypothetical protein
VARTLSPRALASAFGAETDEVWLLLLRIHHPDINIDPHPPGTLRFVNNNEDIVGGSDNTGYVAFPFMFDMPGEDPEAPSIARLRIDNVDLQIVEAVRGLTSEPHVDIELVLASQPTTVEISFEGLTLRAVDYDALEVTGTLTMEEIFTEPVTLEMTPARFPGMF